MKLKILKIIASNLIIILAINIAFYNSPISIDLTHDKRYTLSKASREIMENLEEDVTINLFLDTQLPSNFKRLLIATKDILNQYKNASNNNININLIDPFKNKSIAEQEEMVSFLSSKGIDIMNITTVEDGQKKQKLIIPAAIISKGSKNLGVNLLSSDIKLVTNNQEEIISKSIENLEYTFSIALKQISIKNKPLIGFTLGHSELNDNNVKDISFTLAKLYNVLRVDLKKIKLSDLLKFESIIIAKPQTAFSEIEKYKLDQFLMNNKSVMLLANYNNASNELLMAGQGNLLTTPININLDDMLFKYGLKLNYNIVQDLICSSISVISGSQNQNNTQEIMPWVYYPLLIANKNHIISKKIGSVKSEYISTIDILKDRESRKTVLLTTSKFNRESGLPALVSLEVLGQKPKDKDFDNTPKIAALLLEGKFNSVFKNRNNIFINEGGLDAKYIDKSQDAKLIVISDGNIIKNELASDNSIYPLGFDKYSQITYANKDFISNAVNYISGNADLVKLNAKTIILPLLNKEKAAKEELIWQIINTVLPIILILLFYTTIAFIRKIKLNNY
ncbi:MAG: gliding motility-associated ABC transporter substrate-binding protein GldG [Solitalea-like symbiont of Tyrophagus putrescentiae]